MNKNEIEIIKSALKVLNIFIPCDDDICTECIHNTYCLKEADRYFEWKYKNTNELLNLIGGKIK